MLRPRHTACFLLMFFMFFVCIGGAVHAEDAAPKNDSKEAFIKAWEDNIKAMPTTVIFEKTAVKDVYNFETTLLDYKGKLKIIETEISEYKDKISLYIDIPENILKGKITVEFDIPAKEIVTNHKLSYGAFEGMNTLHYVPESKDWLDGNEFFSYRKSKVVSKPCP